MHVYLPHVYIQKKIIISLSVSSRTVGILKRYKVKVKVMLKKNSQRKYQKWKRFKLQTNANNSKRENTNEASLKSGLHHYNRETHRGCSFAFSCPVLYFSFPLYQNHNSTRRANRKNDQSGLPKPQIHST